MKNLILWDVIKRDLKLKPEDRFIICYGSSEKSSSDIYVCTYNLIVCNYNSDGKLVWSKDLSQLVSLDNKPVNLTYLSLLDTVCVGLSNGELITISDSESGHRCEIAGICDTGLLAMEWSPDQELLTLVTKNLDAILMSCTFDPSYEVNLLSEEFGEKQFITVGWGKKETQFHGSEGKEAAKVKAEVVADPLGAENEHIKITWRGDGHLYAIGFSMNGIRRFKVFDREGHLQYTSEKQQGLESNLAWRPSGNVIATTQKLQDKYVVAFFEKNGLKHGEFILPVNSQTQVEDLCWSTDSEILTVQCRDLQTNNQQLLMFTIGNYHWYLKQILEYNSLFPIIRVVWDNDFDVSRNKTVHVMLKNGETYSYCWIWNVNHSVGDSSNDDAVVSIIDGKKILLTNFRQNVVPPPMASLELTLDSFVNSVHFSSKDAADTNSFFVCTIDNELVFYEQTQKFPLEYKVSKSLQLEKNNSCQYYNWHWAKDDTIVCVLLNEDNNYNLIEYVVNTNSAEEKNRQTLPSNILNINSDPLDNSKLFLQLADSTIIHYELGGSIEPYEVSFGVPCPYFNITKVGKDLFFFGLSHKGNLYINNEMVMNSVSSYFVHTHFLLLTTLHHVLLCTELTQAGLVDISEYQKTQSDAIYRRKIERGAKLVITVPNDTRTVFQMPRGNLEAIQPRPLSLKIIGEQLDQLKYNEAFDLMRKQRINLNLIHDHDPQKFVANIDVFLQSVTNDTWLSLFLSDLENMDVTSSMYSSSYKNKDRAKDNDTKINSICDLIRSQLTSRVDRDSKILPLITTFVKKNTTEDLENALQLIKGLKLKESAGSKLPVGSDEGLKYLLYMVDVNKLFEVALGMYDFDLVLLVANKSQKDPKEYVPMLNELNEMEEHYRKFSINRHLKRYDKAVQSLVQCGLKSHDELKTFVKYHSLYKEALAEFSPDEEIYKQISEDYGLYLRLKKQYIEAGIIYQRAKSYEKAVECYKDALEWELAVSLALTWPKDKFQELCWDLATELKNEKRSEEALRLLEQFYENKEDIISYAIENGHFITSIRLCSQFDKNNLKEEKILPAIMQEYTDMKETIEGSWCLFVRHRTRLAVVRENKRNNPGEVYDAGYANRDSDLYSDAGSTLASSSRGSSRSFRSSKNRRKHERKLASLKEGSQYEDVALVTSLHTLVTSAYELRTPARALTLALMSVGKDHEASLLQAGLDKLLKEMKDSSKQIWTDELVIEATAAAIDAQNVPEGTHVIQQGVASLDPHLRIAPVIHDVKWKLDGLE